MKLHKPTLLLAETGESFSMALSAAVNAGPSGLVCHHGVPRGVSQAFAGELFAGARKDRAPHHHNQLAGTPRQMPANLGRDSPQLIEAQIAETYLLATMGFPSLVATKAARIAEVAGSRGVVEFGTRRAHSPASRTSTASTNATPPRYASCATQ